MGTAEYWGRERIEAVQGICWKCDMFCWTSSRSRSPRLKFDISTEAEWEGSKIMSLTVMSKSSSTNRASHSFEVSHMLALVTGRHQGML